MMWAWSLLLTVYLTTAVLTRSRVALVLVPFAALLTLISLLVGPPIAAGCSVTATLAIFTILALATRPSSTVPPQVIDLRDHALHDAGVSANRDR